MSIQSQTGIISQQPTRAKMARRCSVAVRRMLVAAIGKTGSAVKRLIRRRANQSQTDIKLEELETSSNSMDPAVLLDASYLPQSAKPTLVMDLDETLLHSSNAPISHYDYYYEYTHASTGRRQDVFVRYRPFLIEFIKYAAMHYELIIYTASSQDVGYR